MGLDTIHKAIREREKLLVILSEHSIASTWVEDEVTRAFSEERDRSETVIFPIRVDDAVMTSEKAWAVKIRDNRHIGDFRMWRDRDGYERAFARLLRDLRRPEAK